MSSEEIKDINQILLRQSREIEDLAARVERLEAIIRKYMGRLKYGFPEYEV